MYKKFFSALLSFLMLLCCFTEITLPIEAAQNKDAVKTETSVPVGLSYSVMGGEVTINGYNGSSKELVIPSTIEGFPVTRIKDQAFWAGLFTSVTLPNTLITIGESAFRSCSNLSSIIIPDGVTTIGEYAFLQCGNLTSISIPDSVLSIGGSAFDSCQKLQFNVFDNAMYLGNESNPYYALIRPTSKTITTCKIHPDTSVLADFSFTSCYSLQYNIYDNAKYLGNESNPYFILFKAVDRSSQTCEISSSTVIIAYDAFLYSDITNLNIPDGVIGIGTSAFSDCNKLTSVSIPKSVACIGDSAFYNCCNLTGILVDKDNKYYSSDEYGVLFDKNKTKLLCLPGNIQKYQIPNTVTEIYNYAFINCGNMTSVTIPDGVMIIGKSAFNRCYILSSIIIPETVLYIGHDAFGTTALEKVYFKGNAPEIEGSAFSYKTLTAYYPIGNDTWTENVMRDYGGHITWTPYNPAAMAGDVDGDLTVNNKDVEYLLWYTLFPEDYPIPSDADFNSDGIVNNLDVEHLLWHTLFPEDYPL